jgi:NDP-sugar pyrophosphorylase family protein
MSGLGGRVVGVVLAGGEGKRLRPLIYYFQKCMILVRARMGDLIHFLIDEGERVEAYQTDAFWYDVGSTEKYEKLDNGLVDRLFKV